MLSSSEFSSINAAGSERFKDATVLVAGATGGVGRRVVQRLAREGATVKALVRDFAKGVRPIALQCCGALTVFQSRMCRAHTANCFATHWLSSCHCKLCLGYRNRQESSEGGTARFKPPLKAWPGSSLPQAACPRNVLLTH